MSRVEYGGAGTVLAPFSRTRGTKMSSKNKFFNKIKNSVGEVEGDFVDTLVGNLAGGARMATGRKIVDGEKERTEEIEIEGQKNKVEFETLKKNRETGSHEASTYSPFQPRKTQFSRTPVKAKRNSLPDSVTPVCIEEDFGKRRRDSPG